MPNPVGRPTIYSEELAEEICNAIAVAKCGLEKLCKQNPHFPSRRTILLWGFKHRDFFHRYMQARKHQSHSLIDKMLEVSDNDENDSLIKINRDRIKVDVCKYTVEKFNNEDYGTRVSQVHNMNITHDVTDKARENINSHESK